MTRYGSLLFCFLLLIGWLATPGCGSSRQLQSVTLNPAKADAQNFPNGQVPFTAIGTFNKPPSPVQLTSQDVAWCVGTSNGMCAGNIATGASVDANGAAQCRSGFSGTVTILAGKGMPPALPDGGSQFNVFGTAQLTCP